MDSLLTAIYDIVPTDFMKDLLSHFPIDFISAQDENGLDLLHHAILANNIEGVALLLSLINKSPEGNGCGNGDADDGNRLGYLHLACIVGNIHIVNQFYSVKAAGKCCRWSAWPELKIIQQHLQKGNGRIACLNLVSKYKKILAELSRHPDEDISPLDIAGLANHVGCVRVLLSHCTGAGKKSELELTMDCHSMAAFKLILSLEPKNSDIEAAFKQALREKRPDYMRVLLDHGVNVPAALNGLNPYHFVYQYSSGFHQLAVARSMSEPHKRNEGLDEVTALLIERKFDVNASLPLGTFPLHTLISALILEKDTNPGQVPWYHIRSLGLLIKAKAKLNFDENKLAIKVKAKANVETDILAKSEMAFGRDTLYTSALDAYFSCLQTCDTWRPHVMEYLDRICLELLEAGADPTLVDSRGETPLHVLMRTTAMQHAMGHMHADLSCMCRMLLYFGADPNKKSADGIRPVDLYFTELFKIMGGLFAFRRWKQSDNASQVLQLLYFMDVPVAMESCRSIKEGLTEARVDGMPEEVIQYVTNLMSEFTCQPKSLQELSRLAVWSAVNRRLDNLKKLEMPKAFIAAIKELFSLDI